jgi:glutathione S-transferase
LYVSGTSVEIREVSLRNKPEIMLINSPKGSVPILVLPNGQVIDESWDIMKWALCRHDPENWLGKDNKFLTTAEYLLSQNDLHFKPSLDCYKYFERYPAYSRDQYRAQCEIYLQELENRLNHTQYLLANTHSIADALTFPFIRQFSEVDQGWFNQANYPKLRQWLSSILSSNQFLAVMKKYPIWQYGDSQVFFKRELVE